jgi:hypothetical protein
LGGSAGGADVRSAAQPTLGGSAVESAHAEPENSPRFGLASLFVYEDGVDSADAKIQGVQMKTILDESMWFDGAPMPANPKSSNHSLYLSLKRCKFIWSKHRLVRIEMAPCLGTAKQIQLTFKGLNGKEHDVYAYPGEFYGVNEPTVFKVKPRLSYVLKRECK